MESYRLMTPLLTLARDNNGHVVDDIDDLRQDLMPKLSRLDSLISNCLDAVVSHVNKHRDAAHSSDPSATPPTTPSIQEILGPFGQHSLQSWDPKDSTSYAMFQSTQRSIPGYHAHPPLQTIEDEDTFVSSKHDESGKASPPPLRLNQRNLIGETRPSPIYTLFPPACPPPVKALPPIPPPRSPFRPGPVSPVSLRALRAPNVPIKSRARASSDITLDSKFSTLSSDVSRLSASSHASSIKHHPWASSHATQFQAEPTSPRPDTLSQEILPSFDIIPLRRLDHQEKDTSHGGVFSIDTSTESTVLASRHGKFHIKLWDLPSGPLFTTIKVPFYVQAQARSRGFFIRSHAVLSETNNLIAIATGFGDTLEIWNWAKKKKVQTIHDALRWAAVKADVYESRWSPLATYREEDDTIKLYPVSTASAKKPFGKPRAIELRKAGLPHLPKLPELAYSATGPLLVAAAGPRPPRPNAPPPTHAALLMAWQLDGDARLLRHDHRPYKFLQTTEQHPELQNALPLCLATYGSVAVSIWEPARFRTIGRPGMWQVEPVAVTERVVLVWDFSGVVDKVTTYRIPDVLACVSPDCRFVAYCDPGGARDQIAGGDGALVVLDAIRGGRELWRLDGVEKLEAGASGRASRRSGRSSETKRSTRSSTKSDGSFAVFGGGGLELLAADLQKVTELAFSGDGTRLFLGDEDGGVRVYEIREGIGMSV